jgi:hypothetical protein
VKTFALAALACALSTPSFAQIRRAAPADPQKIDSKLMRNVRDRLIQSGTPTDLGDNGVMDCLDDSLPRRAATLMVCQQFAMLREKPNESGVIHPVLRYQLGEMIVTFADGSNHYTFIIGLDDRVSQIVRIDAQGAPASALLTPELRAQLLQALFLSTSLPLIEA